MAGRPSVERIAIAALCKGVRVNTHRFRDPQQVNRMLQMLVTEPRVVSGVLAPVAS